MTTGEAVESISITVASERLEAGALAIDTRPPANWAGAHLTGALNLPLVAIASRSAEVPTDTDLLFFSEDGVQSMQALLKARELAFSRAFNVEAAFGWTAAGMATEALN